jgi:Uma2 family endonuclease
VEVGVLDLNRPDFFDGNVDGGGEDRVIYMMSSAGPTHQNILIDMSGQFWYYFRNKSCRAHFGTGLDLSSHLDKIKDLKGFKRTFKEQIKKGTEENAHFYPDIQVICDAVKSDFGSNGYKKIPKLVIEIASKSTAKKDSRDKYEIYEAIGVSEYWIVESIEKVSVYILENGEYQEIEYELEKGVNVLEVSNLKFTHNHEVNV